MRKSERARETKCIFIEIKRKVTGIVCVSKISDGCDGECVYLCVLRKYVFVVIMSKI